MIAADQPTVFGNGVKAGISSVSDGMMKPSVYNSPEVNDAIYKNIGAFLSLLSISPDDTHHLVVTYERTDFLRYKTVAEPVIPLERHEPYDSLATDTPGVSLFLPLADCTGAILYDPIRNALMVSHLGRHSTEQKGALESVRYMVERFGSDPANLLVWLSPSPNGTVYPLWKRDNMSLSAANHADLLEAGVRDEHIEVSTVDTVSDTDYYSHSEFLKGNRSEDGRFAIVASLT